MVTNKFPASEFTKCNIKKVERMSKKLCYLLVVRFKNIKCKYYNNFISQSKCRNIYGASYDNGRIIQAKSLEITLTDIDFYFILQAYKCDYEILECYYATYAYLPKLYIDFILDKYVLKTKYKDVDGKELEYIKEKNKFNALFGMTVTNIIRDKVEYDNVKGWNETELKNDEIIELLNKEKNKMFLSYAYGVWVTAYARNNLLQNVIKLDENVIYCDTDSLKLSEGYNKNIIIEYNKKVIEKIKNVSNFLNIDFNKYSPKDTHGKEHILGIFENDGKYDEFITQRC